MLRKFVRVSFCLFMSITFFTIFSPVLKAELISKNDIMAMTITKLEGDSKKMQLAKNTSQPQTAMKESAEDTGFRQRLKEVITVEKKQDFGLAMDSYVRYMPARSLDTRDGKISIIDSSSELSYAFKVRDKLPVELTLDTQYIALNDKERMPVSLPAKLTGMGFGMETTLPFFNIDKTYFRLKVEPTFNSDDWNVNGSTFRIHSQTFLIYQPNEQWTFVGGVGVTPSSENPIFPIAGLIYKPNEKLVFNLIPSRPTISYAFTDKITGFLEGGLSFGEYRVNKDGFKSAVLSYNELHAGLGLKLKVNKYIDASLSAGRMFNRYLKYQDSLGKVDIKNDYYSEFRLEMAI